MAGTIGKTRPYGSIPPKGGNAALRAAGMSCGTRLALFSGSSLKRMLRSISAF
ncbi:hypothetical protein HMPREF3293_02990 [Christensenella minuta]|uniref:Uncharacterized protein n=1 Tax=Christensenella minuta TaxID=626937 RepID=A0A136Q105_9FIRM|nr:hypothetical protein HMPREF3293_02990 [Christensenella minuta]